MIKTRRNLPMLRQLCGDNALARVVLGTTHWGEVDEDEGKMREQQLAKTFWGSKSLRFEQTKVSARAFLDFILGQLPVMIILYFFLFSLFTVFGLTRCIRLMGEVGTGKSTVCMSFAQEHGIEHQN